MLDGKADEHASDDGADDMPCPALFATETMAELSARQGRLADAVAIYRHLVREAEANSDDSPGIESIERIARWKARLAELDKGAPRAGGAAEPAPSVAAPGPTVSARAEPPPTTRARASLVIREPVRSGQMIYADGRDLIVMAPVNPGAQLLADGNIHVYGPLKGRAVAGALGLRDAQVFCLALEAELVGVDAGYVISDDIPPALWGGPARVFLTPEGRCAVAALPVGKAGAPAAAKRTRWSF